MRRVAICATLIVAAGWGAPPAIGSEPFLLARTPESMTTPPPGFRLSGNDAIARARATSKVRTEQRNTGRLRPRALLVGREYWLIVFQRGGSIRAEVEINGRTGRLKYAVAGRELKWPTSARGQHGPYARTVHKLLVLAGLLFLLPFVDFRRPLRLLHLDLLAVLALGVSFGFAEAGNVYASTPLRYPPMLYLGVRLAMRALRRSSDDPGRVTWASSRVLGAALVALLAVRYGLDIGYGRVSDIGYDSLFGADSIIHGYPVYDPGGHLGSYGPVVYLAYLPFTLAFPLTDLSHTNTEGAVAAAIAWDAGTVAALYAIGRRLRPESSQLGLALAFAFAACPWSSLVLSQNTNDGLVAFLLALVLLAVGSPLGRGALLGLATAAKFAPIVVAGLFARAAGERCRRPVVLYVAALAVMVGSPVLAYLPDKGLRGFWDLTLGYELHRSAPFSLWGLHPGLEPLQWVIVVAGGAMAAAAVVLPRERTVPRLAAAGAALLMVAQLTSTYWSFFYVVWFLPYLLVALLTQKPKGV